MHFEFILLLLALVLVLLKVGWALFISVISAALLFMCVSCVTTRKEICTNESVRPLRLLVLMFLLHGFIPLFPSCPIFSSSSPAYSAACSCPILPLRFLLLISNRSFLVTVFLPDLHSLCLVAFLVNPPLVSSCCLRLALIELPICIQPLACQASKMFAHNLKSRIRLFGCGHLGSRDNPKRGAMVGTK